MLVKYGDRPIRAELARISQGIINIKAWEGIEMRIKQSIGAIIGLGMNDSQSNCRDCLGHVFMPASWRAHQVVGHIAVETD